jgi:hypothetical protein
MAKKRSKKRRPPPRRPAQTAAADRTGTATVEEEVPTSRRAERREEAKRERERRIKQQRRHERNRRLIRWGVVVVVLALIAGFVFVQINEGKEAEEAANKAAQAVGCSPIETRQDDLDDAEAAYAQSAIHEPPFAQGSNGIPATAGRHAGSPLPPSPAVYHQPADEANVVHNLEHAYVVVYYRAAGDTPLSETLRGDLEEYARSQSKVLVMPYSGLAHPVDFVAWGKLQTCDPPADVDGGDLVTVLKGFVEQFRGGGLAPEANGV